MLTVNFVYFMHTEQAQYTHVQHQSAGMYKVFQKPARNVDITFNQNIHSIKVFTSIDILNYP